MRPYILEHANVQELYLGEEFNKFVSISMKPNIEKLKEMFEDKAKFAIIFPKIKNLSQEQIEEFVSKRSISIEIDYKENKERIDLDEECLLLSVEIVAKGSDKEIVAGNENFVYQLDLSIDEEMKKDYLAREIVNRIQKSRKEAGVLIDDHIVVLVQVDQQSPELLESL